MKAVEVNLAATSSLVATLVAVSRCLTSEIRRSTSGGCHCIDVSFPSFLCPPPLSPQETCSHAVQVVITGCNQLAAVQISEYIGCIYIK